MNRDELIEKMARAICACCDDDPDSPGDARGHECRWQDYTDCAEAALAAQLEVLDPAGWDIYTEQGDHLAFTRSLKSWNERLRGNPGMTAHPLYDLPSANAGKRK